jgi:competence protein ComEC
LFDVGSLFKSNVGQRVVAPFLDYIGTNKIDAIIISHNDTDHINGIPEVVEHCKVKAVYANDAYFSRTDPWATAEFLNKLLHERGFKIKSLEEDLDLSRSANIRMLWPNDDMSQNEQLSDNDKSQVSLIEFANRKVLLCSDIEKFAQKELLRMFPNLKPDVVIVPHHGSVNTMATDFLHTLDADISICSCSRRSYEKQLAEKPVNNAKTFYTPKDGAIAVRIDTEGALRAETFAERQ